MTAEWKRRIAVMAMGFCYARLILRPMEAQVAKVIPNAATFTGVAAIAVVFASFWFADRIPDSWWDRVSLRWLVPPATIIMGLMVAAVIVAAIVGIAEWEGAPARTWADVMQ